MAGIEIIKSDPNDKINQLVRQSADEIIKRMENELKKRLPKDSPAAIDPIPVSLNAYLLAMKFTNAVHERVIGICLDMQANYNEKMKKDGSNRKE